MDQQINLSSLLTLPGHGQDRGAVRDRGTSQGQGSSQSHGSSHGRRAATQSYTPPGFSPEEIEASHRDKRQCLEPTLGENLPPQNPSASSLNWAPQFSHGNRPVSTRDSVKSEGTTLALS